MEGAWKCLQCEGRYASANTTSDDWTENLAGATAITSRIGDSRHANLLRG